MGQGIQRRVITGLAIASSLSIGISACANAGGGGLTIGEGGAGGDVGSGDAGSENAAAAPSGGKGGKGGSSGSGNGGKGGSGGTSAGTAQGGGDAEGGEPAGTSGAPASEGGSGGGSAGSSGGADASGGVPGGEGGVGNAGHEHGGHGGDDDTSVGGDGAGGEADTGGAGGSGEGGAPATEPRCVFHTDAPVDTGEGEGGAGGAAPAVPTITVEVSPFVGPYLADSAGRTLYGYGADYVGDCQTPPVSNCVADCLQSWPIFDAPVRTLAAGLDEAAFGQITRSDGLPQTTYYGWPLYYYKTDTAKGMINGQGKGKIWFAAETVLPNVNIMRASAANGGMRYLGDDRGRTLYTFAGDTPGAGHNPPVVGCTGSCLLAFRPFEQTQLLPVSYLEPADLSLFVGPSGGHQVAYRGQPLYTAVADTASGQFNGLTTTNGALTVP